MPKRPLDSPTGPSRRSAPRQSARREGNRSASAPASKKRLVMAYIEVPPYFTKRAEPVARKYDEPDSDNSDTPHHAMKHVAAPTERIVARTQGISQDLEPEGEPPGTCASCPVHVDELSRLRVQNDNMAKRLCKVEDLNEALRGREQRDLVRQLDEHYTCMICLEVMAYPVMTHGCGHTFCVICLLSAVFTKLHAACSDWHAPYGCPACRSMLPWPRRGCEPPRPLFELPCGPNRVALAALNECIGKLAAVEPTSDLDPRIAAWLRNGPAAIDWRRRTDIGHQIWVRLATAWPSMADADLVRFKVELGLEA